ncbi:hypothetical protein HYH03_007498 [Edaphochlamys debaryana]|uniref:Uncharacterized protein n=1 Tax=Edaphochlamys debaryana TaxID=47281 RepID=A0A835Y1Y6_9CHLO|nr:hypothetical protein HYH03_007498 [Edaphochlamys debaryana]|eukprot:KAG2494446.1 hypothetical protein HYH03_007498 [Edaphochlamys debaryana]
MALVPFRVSGAAADQSAQEWLVQLPGGITLRLQQQPGLAARQHGAALDGPGPGSGRAQAPRPGPPAAAASTDDAAPSAAAASGTTAPAGAGAAWASDAVPMDWSGPPLSSLADVGLVVWQAGFLLADHLLRHPPFATPGRRASAGVDPAAAWRPVRALDLGTGSGVVGIALAAAGAHVLLTDLPHVLPLAQRNLEANTDARVVRARVCVYRWGDDPQAADAGGEGAQGQAGVSPLAGFAPDLLTAADVLYHQELLAPLMDSIRILSAPHTLSYIAFRVRHGGEVAAFVGLAERAGFAVAEVPPGELHEEYRDEGDSEAEGEEEVEGQQHAGDAGEGMREAAACDARLASALETLHDYFARNSGSSQPGLTLGATGLLVPRTPGARPDPAVDSFNSALTDMRAALGSDYLLALHLHKASVHGMPTFRMRLLKSSDPGSAAAAAPGTASACASPERQRPSRQPGPPPGPQPWQPPPGWEPAGPLGLAACPAASPLHDAAHAFQDANGRLAGVLDAAGLAASLRVVYLTSARTVAVAGLPGPPPAPSAHMSRAAFATAAAAVLALPHYHRAMLARAAADLNAAMHDLALAAAEAPGPASMSALLTHVLCELRELVAAAGGEAALEGYQPRVALHPGPDLALAFSLDPRLGGAPWSAAVPPFPECLSARVRRAWLLLCQLLATHNAAAGQLDALTQIATGFEQSISRRRDTLEADAQAEHMSQRGMEAAAAALERNHVEFNACCLGALQVLRSTLEAVTEELGEAARLAELQCGLMSCLDWSVSVASTAVASPMLSGAWANSLATAPAASAVHSDHAPQLDSAAPAGATSSRGLYLTAPVTGFRPPPARGPSHLPPARNAPSPLSRSATARMSPAVSADGAPRSCGPSRAVSCGAGGASCCERPSPDSPLDLADALDLPSPSPPLPAGRALNSAGARSRNVSVRFAHSRTSLDEEVTGDGYEYGGGERQGLRQEGVEDWTATAIPGATDRAEVTAYEAPVSLMRAASSSRQLLSQVSAAGRRSNPGSCRHSRSGIEGAFGRAGAEGADRTSLAGHPGSLPSPGLPPSALKRSASRPSAAPDSPSARTSRAGDSPLPRLSLGGPRLTGDGTGGGFTPRGPGRPGPGDAPRFSGPGSPQRPSNAYSTHSPRLPRLHGPADPAGLERAASLGSGGTTQRSAHGRGAGASGSASAAASPARQRPGESLAEAYARSALAHLGVQDL